MIAKTITDVISRFNEICDNVIKDCEPVLVARNNNENVVLISQEEYNNMLENIYIRKSPENYKRILESMEQAKSSKLIELNLGDSDD